MSIPGLIIGFREALESLLLIIVAFNYLKSINAVNLKASLWHGAIFGVATSILGGLIINKFVKDISEASEIVESTFGILAVLLITTLIFWMINHSHKMKEYVHDNLKSSLTKAGVFAFGFVAIIREGAEIILFLLAGDYGVASITAGISIAVITAILINFSLIKLKLSILFKVTLVYLILQAGYLLGYSIHEGLAAMKGSQIAEDSFVYLKAFNLSSGIFSHSEGIIGIPLNILVGWYSKPEWIQAIIHYGYVAGIFVYWRKYSNHL